MEKMVPKNNQKKFIQDYITGDKHEITAFEILPSNRDETSIQINFTTNSPHLFKIYGNDMIISTPEISLPHLTKPDSRVLPLQINYPLYETDSITYVLPEKYILVSKLSNQLFETKFGS